MTNTANETKTWPDLAIGLYDKLNERNAEIEYEFQSMTVGVPRSAEPDAPHAMWRLDGKLTIRTRNRTS